MGNLVSGKPSPQNDPDQAPSRRFSLRRAPTLSLHLDAFQSPTSSSTTSNPSRPLWKNLRDTNQSSPAMLNNPQRAPARRSTVPGTHRPTNLFRREFYPHNDFAETDSSGPDLAGAGYVPSSATIPYHLTITTAASADWPTPPRSSTLPPHSRLAEDPANWKWMGGRPFADVPGSSYLLPTDVEELDRLRALHDVLKWAFEGNYSVPLTKEDLVGAKVLDVGCGAGTWVLEMCDTHPDTHFTGVDLVDIYPSPSQWPENCTFLRADMLAPEGLPFPNDGFDLVHMRLMSYGLCADQWQSLLTELKRITKRGGWIQLSEHDAFQYRAGPATSQFVYYATNALQARDVDPFVARSLDTLLRHANLVSVRNTYLSIPCGSWGGRVGTLFKEDVVRSYRAMSPWMAPAMNVSREEFETMLGAMENEQTPNRTYLNWYVACGRKPRIVGNIGSMGVEERDVMPDIGAEEVEPPYAIGGEIGFWEGRMRDPGEWSERDENVELREDS